MKLHSLLTLVFAAMLLCLQSCGSKKEVSRTVSAMAMETVSLGDGHDGTITVRAWGSGHNMGDAIEQAKRNAVYDVVFKGIKKGTDPGQARYPLVGEVNAAERYAHYFDPFFSPGGEFRKFVKEENSKATRLHSAGVSREAQGVVLVVDRQALKKQLIEDGVLNQ